MKSINGSKRLEKPVIKEWQDIVIRYVNDRILLVDDEPSTARSLKHTLRGDRRKIFEAHNGRQGLRLLADTFEAMAQFDPKLVAVFLEVSKEVVDSYH